MAKHKTAHVPLHAVVLGAAILCIAAPAAGNPGHDERYKRNALTVFIEGYADGKLSSIWESPFSNWTQSNFVGLTASREFARTGPHLSWELEGQAIKHFGKQNHLEFTGAIAARWKLFPWNNVIATTIAIGEGLSYATEIPTVEVRKKGEESKLLNYIFVEATFSLPMEPDFALVARVHHRSGVFGLFNGVHDGSNFLGAGLRWRY